MNPSLANIRSIGLFMASLLMLVFLAACQNRSEKDEQLETQARKGPAQVSFENGQTVLTLDTATQKRLGLEFATLAATAARAQATLPAVVLSVQDLATFRNSYLATQRQLQKSRLEADIARKEYTRMKTLFDQNQNISEKSLQSAEGTLQANEADVRASEQQLRLQSSVVRQEWGSVVAEWAVDGSPELQSVFDQREVLVQITMPSDATFAAPKAISLELPVGGQTAARLVSTYPRIDPRIQGRSFLYVAHSYSGLTPNMNLVAHISVGNLMKGLILPTSAVIWSEGKAWVYLETSPEGFTRRAVATDNPVDTGFFVAEGFSAGDRVVTKGAQALLSEEMLLRGQGRGEPDEN